MRRIAAESGPEAVAFAVTTSSGTAISDAGPWVNRLINAFGSPNNCNAYEICSWHRDFAAAFTTGSAMGIPDYERAGCILLWGHNPSTSWLAAAGAVAEARARGAKLVVVDPRRVGLAVKADHWLPVRPGTDGALALAIAGEMIAHDWFDAKFVREWTNGPFLVRDDNGRLLRSEGGFVAWDEGRNRALPYDPASRSYAEPPIRLALSGRFAVETDDGRFPAIRLSPASPNCAVPIRLKIRLRSPVCLPIRSVRRRICCGTIGRWRTTPGQGSSSTPTPRRPRAPIPSCTR
jgi:anaerobic selenocysteine-containing dehydrogenase